MRHSPNTLQARYPGGGLTDMSERSERATRSDSRCGNCPQHANTRRTLTTATEVTVTPSSQPHHYVTPDKNDPIPKTGRPPSPYRSAETLVPSLRQLRRPAPRDPYTPRPKARNLPIHRSLAHPIRCRYSPKEAPTPDNARLAASDSPSTIQRLAPLCSRRIQNPAPLSRSPLLERSDSTRNRRQWSPSSDRRTFLLPVVTTWQGRDF
jgi:hypothetical protein